MFHAHKTEFAEKGWMGTFSVMEGNETRLSSQANSSLLNDSLNNSFVGKTIGGQL